jgi:hypothetical protein
MQSALSLRESPREDLHYRAASLQRDGAHNISGKLSDMAGQGMSPSQRPQHGGDGDPMSSERDRKFLRNRKACLREVKEQLSRDWVETIPQYRNPAKEVAGHIESSEGTVENLRQRGVPDAMARLVLACLAYPEFRARVAKLMGLQADLDPDAQKLMSELVTLMQRAK